jgi:hypothetical protein
MILETDSKRNTIKGSYGDTENLGVLKHAACWHKQQWNTATRRGATWIISTNTFWKLNRE